MSAGTPLFAKLLSPRFEEQVDPDGQNLVTVLHTLYSGNRDFKKAVDWAMRAAFGEDYEELVFSPAADQRIQFRIRWRSLHRAQSAADLSDGTLRFLLLLTILSSPSPAPVIAIDEPETGLHPSMFPIIAEFAVEASRRSQIIFTTHSPQFLDAFNETRTGHHGYPMRGWSVAVPGPVGRIPRILAQGVFPGLALHVRGIGGDGVKFVFFEEGHTEHKAIPRFIKKCLDRQLNQNVGIKTVRFTGWSAMIKGMPKKASLYLKGPDSDQILGVIGLLDLYGPTIYPDHKKTFEERLSWAKQHCERLVGQERFRMFFTVHEVEAWLLSNPELFPPSVKAAFPGRIQNPEQVNFHEPPAKLLNRVYKEKTSKGYMKVTHGNELFQRLDPADVYTKCPNFKEMADYMINQARKAGL